MRYQVPDVAAVDELLEMLVGEVSTAEHDVSAVADQKYVATFINPEDELVAICASDVPFASFSGAALAMIPPDVAKECVSDGKLSASLSENFHEIMNLCSKLMLSETSEHLRLDKTYAPDELPEGVIALESANTQCGFEIDIPRYGKGTLDFYIAA